MSAVCFALLLGFCAALPFEAHISAPTTRLTHETPYEIEFSLTNVDVSPITVSIWGTPLDKASTVFRSDMFEVVNELGVEAIYTGIVMKRIPTLSDFVTLQPNETVSTKVDLLKGYWFPQEGKYFISLKTYIRILTDGKEICPKKLATHDFFSNFTAFDLFTPEVLPIDVLDIVPAPLMFKKDGSDNLETVTPLANCPTANATAIRTADTNAGTLLQNYAQPYLTRACSSATVYVTWFGVCDTSRYSTVTRNINSIESRRNAGYRVDCAGSECTSNTYAYVYPSDSNFNVYVCGAYWRASANTCAYDSRPGTHIHEISHFNAVAGTRDIQYGTSGCQTLARNNPAQAVTNADSYEYFNENCPR